MKLSCQTLDLSMIAMDAYSTALREQIARFKLYDNMPTFLQTFEDDLRVAEAAYNELLIARLHAFGPKPVAA